MAESYTMSAMIKTKLQVFIIGELGAFGFLKVRMANNSEGLEELLSFHCGCVVATLYSAVISQLM